MPTCGHRLHVHRLKQHSYIHCSDGAHHCTPTTGAREGQRVRKTHLRKATESNPDHSQDKLCGGQSLITLLLKHILMPLCTPHKSQCHLPPPPPMGTQLAVLCYITHCTTRQGRGHCTTGQGRGHCTTGQGRGHCTHAHLNMHTCTRHRQTDTHTHPSPLTFQRGNVHTVWFEGKLRQGSSDVDLAREDTHTTHHTSHITHHKHTTHTSHISVEWYTVLSR